MALRYAPLRWLRPSQPALPGRVRFRSVSRHVRMRRSTLEAWPGGYAEARQGDDRHASVPKALGLRKRRRFPRPLEHTVPSPKFLWERAQTGNEHGAVEKPRPSTRV